MRHIKSKYGEWALLVGAAEGIGEAFSRQLAGQGINLVMLDKNEESLFSLAEELKREYEIEIKQLVIDLNDARVVDRVQEEIEGLNCGLMIYIAAFSLIRKFQNHAEQDLDNYMNVNIAAPLKLSHAFSRYLMARGKGGGMLFMSSLAGLLGMQCIAPYAGSKAFAWNLAEGLYHELKPQNIDVGACIAGATLTRQYLNTKPKYGTIKPQLQSPDEVARFALKKLGKKAFFISGLSNRINYFLLTRLLPRKLAGRMANNVIGKMYDYV